MLVDAPHEVAEGRIQRELRTEFPGEHRFDKHRAGAPEIVRIDAAQARRQLLLQSAGRGPRARTVGGRGARTG